MSFTAWQASVREALPAIVADPNNHKNTAVIRHGYLMADRHGWNYVNKLGTLTRQRDASPLANFQAAAQYFLAATDESSLLTP